MSHNKVAHLTSVHQAFDTRIYHKECKTLAVMGLEVVLIVPHTQDEVASGVSIRAVPRPTRRLERMALTTYQVYRAAVLENAAVYHLHDPELLPFGLLLRLRGKQVIYDVHEDLPRQVLGKSWIPRWVRQAVSHAVEFLENCAGRLLSGVVAATPEIGARFPQHKTVVVQNFPALEEFIVPSGRSYEEREPVAAYVGGITELRGARQMIEAVALAAPGLKCKLVLAGSFDSVQLLRICEEMTGWRHVEYRGVQSREGVACLLQEARVGLNVLHPIPNYYYQPYSVKMFEYMAAGIPVIASDFPPWRRYLEDLGCCLFVDPHNPKAIAEAIKWVLENPAEAAAIGRRGQQATKDRFNWEQESGKLLALYKGLLRTC